MKVPLRTAPIGFVLRDTLFLPPQTMHVPLIQALTLREG